MADLLVEAKNRLAVMRQELPSGTLRLEKYDLTLIERLTQQLEELRQLLDDAKRGNAVLKRKASLHEAQINDMKAEVKAAHTDKENAIALMRQEHDAALAELGTLREHFDSVAPRLDDLRRERADLITERSELKNQLKQAHKQISTGRAGEEELRGEWLEMKAERDAALEKLKKVEDQLAAEKNTSGVAGSVVDDLTQQLERKTQDMAELLASLPEILTNTVESVYVEWVDGKEPSRQSIEEEFNIHLRAMKERSE